MASKKALSWVPCPLGVPEILALSHVLWMAAQVFQTRSKSSNTKHSRKPRAGKRSRQPFSHKTCLKSLAEKFGYGRAFTNYESFCPIFLIQPHNDVGTS